MRFDKRLFLYACVSGVAAASFSSATFAQDSTKKSDYNSTVKY